MIWCFIFYRGSCCKKEKVIPPIISKPDTLINNVSKEIYIDTIHISHIIIYRSSSTLDHIIKREGAVLAYKIPSL